MKYFILNNKSEEVMSFYVQDDAEAKESVERIVDAIKNGYSIAVEELGKRNI